MRTVPYLLVADLRSLVRDRTTWISLAMVVVMGALGPAGLWLKGRLDPPEPPEVEPSAPTWPCQEGKMGSVAWEGDVPDWLRWPDAPVPAQEAQTLVRVGPDAEGSLPIQVVALEKGAPTQAVLGCLTDRIAEERTRRLDALGIPARAETAVAVKKPYRAPKKESELPFSASGATLAGSLFYLAISLFLEVMPRHRASGWMETRLTLPCPQRDAIWAWWILGVGVLSVSAVLLGLGDLLATRILSVDGGPVPWALLPVLVPVLSALGVRTFIDVPDFRAGLIQTTPVLLGLVGAVMGAWYLEQRYTGWGGAVPVGGLLLAAAGATRATGLAMGTALVGGGLALLDAWRKLEHMEVLHGGLGATAARRARGEYGAEILLLLGLAALGAFVGVGMPFGVHPVALAALGLVLFMLVPAVVLPTPLRLERRDLLSWRLPPWRAWVALPGVVLGNLALAWGTLRLVSWLRPHDPLVDLLEDAMRAFASPLGLLVLSVGAGVCEEFLFRGAILGLLRKRWPTWAAVILQALAFALLHGLAVRMPFTFALGLVLGFLVVRTRSLWPAIVAHAAHNGLVMVLPMDTAPPWAVAVGALVGVACLGWLGRGRSSNR